MSPWTQRKDNRRRIIMASNNIGTAIDHLMRIHETYPEEERYEQHRELLKAFCIALDQIKEGLVGYRETV